ncbi:MAG TPA: SCP2 sterol-binding domain-containing protein [Candidatus Methylomirabilis sp.]|jgi:putative sterol carrier protein|nr:SCP2 sterol-binding domain-containing protein [Candidatus Methylomirabilis sp.]
MAGDEAPRTPDAPPDLAALLARLPAALDPGAAAGVEGVVQFDLTGEGGATYFLAIQGGACTVGEGRHPGPNVVLTLSAADCVAVITGAVKARALFDTGRLQIAGNLFLALLLRDLFPRDRLLR